MHQQLNACDRPGEQTSRPAVAAWTASRRGAASTPATSAASASDGQTGRRTHVVYRSRQAECLGCTRRRERRRSVPLRGGASGVTTRRRCRWAARASDGCARRGADAGARCLAQQARAGARTRARAVRPPRARRDNTRHSQDTPTTPCRGVEAFARSRWHSQKARQSRTRLRARGTPLSGRLARRASDASTVQLLRYIVQTSLQSPHHRVGW